MAQRGRLLRSASCQQASHLQREDGLSYDACQQHPTPCLSQPNSTCYPTPPVLLRNMVMCFARMRASERANERRNERWGEEKKKTEKPGAFSFSPRRLCLRSLRQLTMNASPSFLPSAMLRRLLPLLLLRVVTESRDPWEQMSGRREAPRLGKSLTRLPTQSQVRQTDRQSGRQTDRPCDSRQEVLAESPRGLSHAPPLNTHKHCTVKLPEL